jgi:shikimate kinase
LQHIGIMSSRSEGDNLILVGFMGVGKSTVGRELERLGGLCLIDLDSVIVQLAGHSIPEIFATEGEERFRDYEAAALRSLVGVRRMVIATGGGIIGREENWKVMHQLGPIVYLRAAWVTLRKRLVGSQGRPLADAGLELRQVEELWRRRLPLYEQADISVDTDDLNATEVAMAILQKIGRREGKINA